MGTRLIKVNSPVFAATICRSAATSTRIVDFRYLYVCMWVRNISLKLCAASSQRVNQVNVSCPTPWACVWCARVCMCVCMCVCVFLCAHRTTKTHTIPPFAGLFWQMSHSSHQPLSTGLMCGAFRDLQRSGSLWVFDTLYV